MSYSTISRIRDLIIVLFHKFYRGLSIKVLHSGNSFQKYIENKNVSSL